MQQIIKYFRNLYHGGISYFWNTALGRPSEHMIVIGITGTKGKTSTVVMLYQVLTNLGIKTGLSSSVYFANGIELTKNPFRNSMPGLDRLHRLMSEAQKNGCTVFIIEVTSEGLVQNRHRGIHFDSIVLTNLYPEHLDSHGGFHNYRRAKRLLFDSLNGTQPKVLQGKIIKQLGWLNKDDQHMSYYRDASRFPLKYVSVHKESSVDLIADGVHITSEGFEYTLLTSEPLERYQVRSQLLGEFMVVNSMFVIGIAHWLGYSYPEIIDKIESIPDIPGRMNKVWDTPLVFVDYAHIPEALIQVYKTLNSSFKKTDAKTIAVLGSCGGGRDVWKRSPMGKVAAEMNDYVIVTDEDPYDEDPRVIIDHVFEGVIAGGKEEGVTAWKILSRREAIEKAFQLARPQDIIVITGKGSETSIMRPHGAKESWNDREVVIDISKSFQK